ncbi:MAG TPA: hypothetical protein VGL79_05630, partial [Solirubrobacteraceae bacterium]
MTGDAPTPEAENVQTAIDRYRDLAKYLIGIFAATGALLVAGTQLSSIGELSWHDDRARLIASILGLAVAIAAVFWIIRRAVDVLRPIDLSLEQVSANNKLRTKIESEPGLLGGAQKISVLAALVKNPSVTSKAQRDSWKRVVDGVVERAAYLEMERRFERALHEMIAAAVIGAIGITVLAWAANPPKDKVD